MDPSASRLLGLLRAVIAQLLFLQTEQSRAAGPHRLTRKMTASEAGSASPRVQLAWYQSPRRNRQRITARSAAPPKARRQKIQLFSALAEVWNGARLPGYGDFALLLLHGFGLCSSSYWTGSRSAGPRRNQAGVPVCASSAGRAGTAARDTLRLRDQRSLRATSSSLRGCRSDGSARRRCRQSNCVSRSDGEGVRTRLVYDDG